MDLRHLEVFDAVMRTGTTVGAAQLLCASQPSVSNTIRNLEDILGFDLFDRMNGRLVPTEEAKMLFKEAQNVFAAFAATRRLLEEIQGNRAGTLTVAATPTVGNTILPKAVADFVRPRPDVKVGIEIEHLDNVIRMVDRGAADLGIAVNASAIPTVIVEPLAAMPMVCVLPSQHPLAALEAVTPADIADYPLISFSRDTVLGRHIEHAFQQEGAGRTINIEVRYCETARRLVQRGAGVAIIDPFAIMGDPAPSDLVVRRFEPHIEARACVIRSKLRRPPRLAQQFLTTLGKHFAAIRHGDRSGSEKGVLPRSTGAG